MLFYVETSIVYYSQIPTANLLILINRINIKLLFYYTLVL